MCSYGSKSIATQEEDDDWERCKKEIPLKVLGSAISLTDSYCKYGRGKLSALEKILFSPKCF